MSETPPMPSDLLKRGKESARARAELFAKQDPKGDGPVLSMDDTTKDTDIKGVPAISTVPDGFKRQRKGRVYLTPEERADKEAAKKQSRLAAATVATPVASPVMTPAPVVDPTISGAVEKNEEEKMLDFVQSIPEGGVILLVSPGKAESHYYRDGDDLMKGKIRKQTGDIVTKKVWEKINKPGWNWKIKKDAFVATKVDVDLAYAIRVTEDARLQALRDEEEKKSTVAPVAVVDVDPPAKDVDLLDATRVSNEARLQALQEEEGSISIVPEREQQNSVNERVLETREPEERQNEKVVVTMEMLDAEIARLTTEMEKMRAKYVEANHKKKSVFKRLRDIFGKNLEDENQEREWRAEYEKALSLLKDAEMKKLKLSKKTGKDLRKDTEGLLAYFKIKEATNLIEAEDAYRSENKGWSQKILNSGRAIGEWYNKRSFKEKIVVGSLVTLGVAGIGLSGGGVLFGSAALFLKKVIASAGLSVAFDAKADKATKTRFEEQAWKEINAELERMFGEEGRETPQMDQAEMLSHLDNKLGKYTKELSQNFNGLISERKLNGVKGAALGFGIVFGGGAAVQYGMNELGGNEAVGWVKNHLGGGTLGDGARPERLPDIMHRPDNIVPIDTSVARVEGLLHGTYDVKPGDSIWKIIGSSVDGLDGPQKTYFIDALKDKLAVLTPEELRGIGIQSGDINNLAIGEKIDFSKLTQGDWQQAFEHARDLSSEKIASIAMNDAKIAEYVSSHPGTTLTEESVDRILHGEAADVFQATEVIENNSFDPLQSYDGANAPGETPSMYEEYVAPVESDSVVTEEFVEQDINTEPVFTADLQPRVNDWYSQIFKVENPISGQDWISDKTKIGSTRLMDILKDAQLYRDGTFSGYRTGLNSEQVKNFAEFFQNVEKNNIVFDRRAFFHDHPGATVMDYLKKVAPLVTPGERLGLYTTTH